MIRTHWLPLVVLLVASTPTWGQDLAPAYRLEGRDTSARFSAVVSFERDEQGELTAERSAFYVEGGDQSTFTWASRSVDVQDGGHTVFVTYDEVGENMSSALEEIGGRRRARGVHVVYRVRANGELLELLQQPITGVAHGEVDYPVLELEVEEPLESLLGDRLGRYEASGVDYHRDHFYVVFDNSYRIGVLPRDLDPDRCELTDPEGPGQSDFEGLAYNAERGRFYAVVEAEGHRGDWEARVWEYDLNEDDDPDDLDYKRRFWLEDHDLRGEDGKGVEGLAHVRRDGTDYVLAMLEGNRGRDGRRGLERGYGRVEVFEREGRDKWDHAGSIRLPRTAFFRDYSGIDLEGDQLVVVSQTSSLLWVGTLSPDTWEIEGEGEVYRFPRLRSRILYGSVEGVAWMGGGLLAVVSDRDTEEREECEATEESIHVFRLPPTR
jgi:Esterase-like activity of phytase